MASTGNHGENTDVSSARIDWNLVFDQNRPWLRSVVHARLGEPQAVDEVLQEVALAITSGRHSLANPQKITAWMYQIAVRQTLLYRRKHGRRRKLIDRYADTIQPTEADCRTPDPLTWLIADEQADLFRQAMENLPGRDREILMLKYHHEWTYREIAQQLDLSESAVEARLHRARKRLRQRLVRCQVVEY